MATKILKLQVCVFEGIGRSCKAYVWHQVSSSTQNNSIYDMSKKLSIKLRTLQMVTHGN